MERMRRIAPALVLAACAAVLTATFAPAPPADAGDADVREALRKIRQARELIGNEDPKAGRKGAEVLLSVIVHEVNKGRSEEWDVSGEVLIEASDALAEARHPKVAEAVARAGDNRKWWAMSYYCTRALGGMKVEGIEEHIQDALDDERNVHRRLGAAEALRLLYAGDATLEMLKQGLEDEVWEVRITTARAFETKKGDKYVDALVRFLEESSKGDIRPRAVAMESLGKITGKNFGYSARTWIDWWRLKKEGQPTKGMTTYYGIPVISGRTAFIMDVSGSMGAALEDTKKLTVRTGDSELKFEIEELQEIYEEWRTKTVGLRLEAAQRELVIAIAELPEDQRFTVIFYSSSISHWTEKLMRATEENKLDAIKEVLKQGPVGATNLFDATADSLRFSEDRDGEIVLDDDDNYMELFGGVDTIFLMTDGVPNTGALSDPDKIVNELRKVAEVRKVTIHTICMGASSGGDADLMERIAKVGNGRYVGID